MQFFKKNTFPLFHNASYASFLETVDESPVSMLLSVFRYYDFTKDATDISLLHFGKEVLTLEALLKSETQFIPTEMTI